MAKIDVQIMIIKEIKRLLLEGEISYAAFFVALFRATDVQEPFHFTIVLLSLQKRAQAMLLQIWRFKFLLLVSDNRTTVLQLSPTCPFTLPLSVSGSHIFSSPNFSLQFTMACRNLCDRLHSKMIFGKSQYERGKKSCRRCEVYYCDDGVFLLR